MSEYETFLASKRLIVPNCGIEVATERLNPHLYPFQASLVQWALRKGRAACFAGTGLGKTRIQLAWAEHAAERTLILAPLAVAQQTVREGERIGIPVTYARRQEQAAPQGITITNYEMLDHFDAAQFGACVLDESSILKQFTGKTKNKLIAAFRNTPMRLCASATPAPNDVVELLNHADFLSIMPAREMLSRFFTPRGVENSHAGQYRLKKHAVEPFYDWLASWSVALSRPSDLGEEYSDSGYDLPPLTILPQFVESDYQPADRLFADRLKGVQETAAVRRATIAARGSVATSLIEAEPEEQWLVWCGLNAEAELIRAAVPGAIEVKGPDDPDKKAAALLAFADGETRVLVTKLAIGGHGLNLQRCARMVFVGIGHSYEQYYQGLRRCWRYGQGREVKAYVVITEAERSVYENVIAKEQGALETGQRLRARGWRRRALAATTGLESRGAGRLRLPVWLNALGGDGNGNGC